jgi:hypothetical protein
MHIISCRYVLHVLPISVFLFWSPECYLVRSTQCKASRKEENLENSNGIVCYIRTKPPSYHEKSVGTYFYQNRQEAVGGWKELYLLMRSLFWWQKQERYNRRTCSTNGRSRNYIRILVRRPEWRGGTGSESWLNSGIILKGVMRKRDEIIHLHLL